MAKKVLFQQPIALKKGMSGLQVLILQVILLALGFNREKMLPDGDYGDETEAAVKEYKENSLVDGIEEEEGVGPLTAKALIEEDGVDFTLLSYEESVANEETAAESTETAGATDEKENAGDEASETKKEPAPAEEGQK